MDGILMIVLMLAVMYFILIRPENKRRKKAQEMRDGLKKGDVITTIGGIIGKIVKVDANTIVIETGEDRVRLELAKWAVSQTGVQSSEEPEKKSKKEAEPAAIEASEEKKD